MVRRFEEYDKGKRVLTAGGDVIGTITRVAAGRAYVDPERTLARTTRQRLGWTSGGDYELDRNAISKITDDEIRLKPGE